LRIFLTGFMGAGKSSVGRALAARLGVPFVDLDAEIVARTGATIPEIFAAGGEGEFRRLEREALEAVLTPPELADAVIATGGGTVAWAGTAERLAASGATVWLNLPFAAIVERIGALGKRDRPLFRDETQAFALYRERLAAYRRCDLEIAVAAEESPEEVAARVEQRLADVVRLAGAARRPAR
jgi:shikimate kinase